MNNNLDKIEFNNNLFSGAATCKVIVCNDSYGNLKVILDNDNRGNRNVKR